VLPTDRLGPGPQEAPHSFQRPPDSFSLVAEWQCLAFRRSVPPQTDPSQEIPAATAPAATPANRGLARGFEPAHRFWHPTPGGLDGGVRIRRFDFIVVVDPMVFLDGQHDLESAGHHGIRARVGVLGGAGAPTAIMGGGWHAVAGEIDSWPGWSRPSRGPMGTSERIFGVELDILGVKTRRRLADQDAGFSSVTPRFLQLWDVREFRICSKRF